MLDGLMLTMAKVMGVKPEELQAMATATFNNVQAARDTLDRIEKRLAAIETKLGIADDGATHNG